MQEETDLLIRNLNAMIAGLKKALQAEREVPADEEIENLINTRLQGRAYKMDAFGGDLQQAIDYLRKLSRDRARLLRGEFQKEEIHNICHNLAETVPAKEFAAGCAREQQRIYGHSPDFDMLLAALALLETVGYNRLDVEELCKKLPTT